MLEADEVTKGMKVTSIVLCGGKNLRLGRNKALEMVESKTLIERVCERLKPVTNQLLVVTSREQLELPVCEETGVLVDLYPDRGPLGGIYTGLVTARSSHSLVVACDMPFLSITLLRYMIRLAPDYDAVVPRLGERMLEPLHAIYAKSCLDKIKARLEQNQLGVHTFFKTMRVRYIERDECMKFDPELLSFFNINYQRDLDEAITLVKSGH